MAASDQGGFFTTFPTVDTETSASNNTDDTIWARQFTCPSSGVQDINIIGMFAEIVASSSVRFLIYDDNGAEPGADGSYVANSLTGEVLIDTDHAWHSTSYGTKPQCTAGVEYWLAVWGNSAGVSAAWCGRFSFSGGTSASSPRVYDASDPPAAESWTGTGNTIHMAVEYQAAGAGGGVIPQVMILNRRRRL